MLGKKTGRLPRRSAVVAFSAADVYKIAEFIKRHWGGAAVVMGRLSPELGMRKLISIKTVILFPDRHRCDRYGAQSGSAM